MMGDHHEGLAEPRPDAPGRKLASREQRLHPITLRFSDPQLESQYMSARFHKTYPIVLFCQTMAIAWSVVRAMVFPELWQGCLFMAIHAVLTVLLRVRVRSART